LKLPIEKHALDINKTNKFFAIIKAQLNLIPTKKPENIDDYNCALHSEISFNSEKTTILMSILENNFSKRNNLKRFPSHHAGTSRIREIFFSFRPERITRKEVSFQVFSIGKNHSP